jgi:hypothetical protein
MKQFVRSVPVILFLSVASLSLIAFAGCGGATTSSSGSDAPTAAKNVYTIEDNSTGSTYQFSIVAFSATATGSTTTPASTLTLPSNFLATSMVVGPQGQIYVAGEQRIAPGATIQAFGTILEYAAGATGSATPTVTLNGSGAGTSTFRFTFSIAVNSANTLFVSSDDGSIETFASGFTATSVPTQYLTWSKTNIGSQGGLIAVDNAGDIFQIDYGTGGPGTRTVIDVFAAGTTGNTAPARVITGTNTTFFYFPVDSDPIITADGAGDLYIAYYNESDDPNDTFSPDINANEAPTGIYEFAAGASGNATPTRVLSGALTKIVEPEGLALDVEGNLYYLDGNAGFWSQNVVTLPFEVFPATATGNVAPTSTFSAASYTDEVADGADIAAY